MQRLIHLLVAYDVSSNRERARVDKVLKGFGTRVQKSVFEVRTDTRGIRELRNKLSELQITTGFAAIYRLNAGARSLTFGAAPDTPPEAFAFVI